MDRGNEDIQYRIQLEFLINGEHPEQKHTESARDTIFFWVSRAVFL